MGVGRLYSLSSSLFQEIYLGFDRMSRRVIKKHANFTLGNILIDILKKLSVLGDTVLLLPAGKEQQD